MICDLVIEFTSTKSHINDSAIIGIMNAQIKGTAFFFYHQHFFYYGALRILQTGISIVQLNSRVWGWV